jgi:hypothetical protein
LAGIVQLAQASVATLLSRFDLVNEWFAHCCGSVQVGKALALRVMKPPSGGVSKQTRQFWIAYREGVAADSLWQQYERVCETRTDPNCSKIPTVSGQNSVDTSPFSNGSDASVDETQIEISELSVELKRANHVERNGRLILVSRLGIEDLRYELSHCRPLVSKKVIYLGKNQRRHDHQPRRRQNLLVVREARFAICVTGECPKKSAGVCDNWWDQFSRSRNSSASSPSLLSVD